MAFCGVDVRLFYCAGEKKCNAPPCLPVAPKCEDFTKNGVFTFRRDRRITGHVDFLFPAQYQNEKTVLLTDDGDFAGLILRERPGWIVPNMNPVHTKICNDRYALLHTFYDLLILTRASKIVNFHQFTGKESSGFSRIPAKLFGIPFEVVKIS